MTQALGGKKILVTGASRGIGASCAQKIIEAGGDVILHASGASDASRAVTEQLGLAPEQFIFEDLSRDGAGARLAEKAIKAAGRIDGVINNAGIFTATALGADDDEWAAGWRRTMAVNVQAPADICRSMIAHFREQGGGAIINIASRAGHRGDGVDNAGYAASKGAVLAMTKTWARGLAGENILLYAVAPGWVETRMAPQDIEARKKAVVEIPLGRVAAPDEVGAMCVFLLTGACESAAGATFDINGASYVR